MANFEIRNLSFFYPEEDGKVLDDISLEISQGEYVVICGRSGCGKTTLLRHLKSALTPGGTSEGEVRLDGRLLADVDLRRQAEKIGYVMQEPVDQIVTDKVWHEMAFGLENLGVPQDVIRLRVAEMAEFFGIQSWFHKSVSELSGGQKQLLNLASVMAMQPEVLILDEPTSRLDPVAASDFLNAIRKINRELGTGVIIAEHRLDGVLDEADRLVVMDRGRIIADGSPREAVAVLKESGSEMFQGMPAAVQVYYGLLEILRGRESLTERYGGVYERLAGDGDYAADNLRVGMDGLKCKCPLTVREGRRWLSELLGDLPHDSRSRSDVSAIVTGNTQSGNDRRSDSPAISAGNLWFRYEKNGDDILKGLSLKVMLQSVYAILGGNGTGKTTLLKVLCGLYKPYKGKIRTTGLNISMMPQEPRDLFLSRTVQEELEDKDEMLPEDLKEIAEKWGLLPLLERHPYDLSVGEQQRLALAKVLLADPDVLLLDEPTKGMDVFSKETLGETLRKLIGLGKTVIMVSHDVDFCARYADRVGMIFDGQIVAEGSSSEFFAGNGFYTTAANRMSRHVFNSAITPEDVTAWCEKILGR